MFLFHGVHPKKISVSALVLTLLFSALAGSLLANLAKANPIGALLPHDPQAIISVQYPANHKTVNACDVTVYFSVDLHEWIPPWPDWNPDYSFSSTITCILDGQYVSWQETVLNSPRIHHLSIPLKGLSNGFHDLRIKVVTDGTYFHGTYSSDPVWGGWSWKQSNVPIIDYAYLRFEVAADSPELVILSLKQHESYAKGDLPLDFAVSTPVSWVGYSLDGQDNVTVAGNLTLAGLSDGIHNVTVYARDDARNFGASETVIFTVAQVSSTKQLIVANNVAPSTAILITSATVVSFGLVVYFLRRKKRRSTA
jgi:hypothetical protein